LSGGEGQDNLDGGADDDYLIDDSVDDDAFIGGTGIDTVDYSWFQGGISAIFDYYDVNYGRVDGVDGFIGADSLLEIENLIGGSGNDQIYGSSENINNVFNGDTGDDYIDAGGGDDVSLGGEGDDVIRASGGSDTIDGGNGIDTVNFLGLSTDYDFNYDIARQELYVQGLSGLAFQDSNEYITNVEFFRFENGLKTLADLGLRTTNVAPDAVDDVATVKAGSSIIIDVGVNDLDADGDTLFVTSFTQPAHGTLSRVDGSPVVNVTTKLLYTPNPGYSGSDTFTYTLSDGSVVGQAYGGTDTAAVNIAVTPENTAPIVATVILPQSSPEDTTWIFNIPAGTFSDAEDTNLALSATLKNGGPLPTWLTFNAATGTFSGTPPLNFNGNLVIALLATDSGGLSVSADVELAITPVNDDPVAVNDVGFIASGLVPLVISPASLLANDTDVDGDSLSIISVAGATNGSVRLDNGNVSFTAAAGVSGIGTFTYTVTDSHGGTSSATANVLIPVVTGTNGSDNLIGTANNDSFQGGGGRDTIRGLGGNDTINGGAGADIIDGGEGIDTADYSTSRASVNVVLGATNNFFPPGIGSGGDASGDTLFFIENLTGSNYNDSLTGNGGKNVLMGGAGNDTLLGLGGDDTLDGGLGLDVLSGGGGSDSFTFGNGFGADTIVDFQDGRGTNDMIDVRGFGFGTYANLQTHVSFVQVNGNAILRFDSGDVLTVLGQRIVQLGADDFNIL
jgi:Ca2+-binding RTX toxin-like protein